MNYEKTYRMNTKMLENSMRKMRKRYQQEFLTRKANVQVIYNNICEYDTDCVKNSLQSEHMMYEEFDREVFKVVMNKVMEMWQTFSIAEYEEKGPISRCAQAVLRAGFAELDLAKTASSIVIDEYLEVSKMFCENETGVINKILDAYLKMSASKINSLD